MITEQIKSAYNDMLCQFQDTLERTSLDTSKSEYMTSSQTPVVNFDRLKGDFIKDMALTQSPLSCDALYFHQDTGFFLIEFKNGKIEAKKNYEINVKILESLHIFTEKVVQTTAFTRENLTFILVYNEHLEHGEKQFENIGIDKIKQSVYTLAKTRIIRFGLRRFQTLYFKDVFTFSKAEFETRFVSKYCS
jgi:hypothetical protein